MNQKITRRSFTRLTLILPLASALVSVGDRQEKASHLSHNVLSPHADEPTRHFLERYQALMKSVREINLPSDLAPFFVVFAAPMDRRDEAAHG